MKSVTVDTFGVEYPESERCWDIHTLFTINSSIFKTLIMIYPFLLSILNIWNDIANSSYYLPINFFIIMPGDSRFPGILPFICCFFQESPFCFLQRFSEIFLPVPLFPVPQPHGISKLHFSDILRFRFCWLDVSGLQPQMPRQWLLVILIHRRKVIQEERLEHQTHSLSESFGRKWQFLIWVFCKRWENGRIGILKDQKNAA